MDDVVFEACKLLYLWKKKSCYILHIKKKNKAQRFFLWLFRILLVLLLLWLLLLWVWHGRGQVGLRSGRSSGHCGSVHFLRHLGYLCDVWSVVRVRTDAGSNQLTQLRERERERERERVCIRMGVGMVRMGNLVNKC